MHVCVCVCVCVCMDVYIHTFCVWIYTCMQSYIHTNIPKRTERFTREKGVSGGPG